MNPTDLTAILKDLEKGLISAAEAESKLSDYNFVDVDSITYDLGREQRCGTPEVIYSESKSVEQLTSISRAFRARKIDVLFSRLKESQLSSVDSVLPEGRYNTSSRTFLWRSPDSKLPLTPASLLPNVLAPVIAPAAESISGISSVETRSVDSNTDDDKDALVVDNLEKVVIVSAGSSDAFVVDEICETLFLVYGCFPKVISDCGVAGIHRILSHSKTLSEASVVVTVAGMDGALPTVTAGMTKAPVIAVPTSVGYGPLGNGIAPLISMLASCAPGLVVVNVDNGVGAAFAVKRILSAIGQEEGLE